MSNMQFTNPLCVFPPGDDPRHHVEAAAITASRLSAFLEVITIATAHGAPLEGVRLGLLIAIQATTAIEECLAPTEHWREHLAEFGRRAGVQP
ncbi:MAG: hypothetical protein KDI73_11680 [Candidatus Competibacteraceae bacterium]|nr:hypothetical protein [Candidatus Competibacteraceae bacterium]